MSAYLLAGVILAVILIAFYVYRAWPNPELTNAGAVLLGATGLTTGVKLFVLTVTTEHLEKPFSDEDHVYIILGALALIWVSGEATLRALVVPNGDGNGNGD